MCLVPLCLSHLERMPKPSHEEVDGEDIDLTTLTMSLPSGFNSLPATPVHRGQRLGSSPDEYDGNSMSSANTRSLSRGNR